MTDDPREGLPALVDLHCHGALGHHFGVAADPEGAAAATLTALAHHRRRGVGRVVASLVSARPDVLTAQVRVLAPFVAAGDLAGIHLEGPFLAPSRRGAHDPSVLTDPDLGLLARLVETASIFGAPHAIRHLTYAPERDGASALVRELAAYGITPAVGHTDADAATVTRAIDAIVEATGRPALVTHLFNGMPPMHHRAGGPVAAALAAAGRGDAVLELIADGVHVAPEVVRMVFETVGSDRVVLVSDAMAATGLGDGDYDLGGLPVHVRGGVARLTGEGSAGEGAIAGGGGAIAGSTSTLADCVAWAIEVAGLPRAEVVRAASTTPGRVLTR